MTVSVGGAVMWPCGSEQPDRLVRTADDALYEAKSQGRNRAAVYHLENQMDATTTLRAMAL